MHCILEFQTYKFMLINFTVQVDCLSKPWLILLTESITVAIVILAAGKAKNTRFKCAPACVCCVWCNAWCCCVFVLLCRLSNNGLLGPAVRSLTQEDVVQTLSPPSALECVPWGNTTRASSSPEHCLSQQSTGKSLESPSLAWDLLVSLGNT